MSTIGTAAATGSGQGRPHSYRLYYKGGMADFTVVEHKSLLDAFRNHNAAAAAATMRSHLERSRDRFIKIASSEETGGRRPPAFLN